MEHTQSNWKISKVLSDKNNICITSIGQDQKVIANVILGDNNEESNANAKLIAAAPVMLFALIKLDEYEKRCRAKGNPNISDSWYTLLQKAITLATE